MKPGKNRMSRMKCDGNSFAGIFFFVRPHENLPYHSFKKNKLKKKEMHNKHRDFLDSQFKKPKTSQSTIHKFTLGGIMRQIPNGSAMCRIDPM